MTSQNSQQMSLFKQSEYESSFDFSYNFEHYYHLKQALKHFRLIVIGEKLLPSFKNFTKKIAFSFFFFLFCDCFDFFYDA